MRNFSENNFFVGLGVEKCGTTSLNSFLGRNERFVAPHEKETLFFTHHFDRGTDGHRALYPEISTGKQNLWHLDITPSYFRRPDVIRRILNYCKGGLVVALLLRNPIARAFSHYWHDIVHHYSWGQRDAGRTFENHSFFAMAESGTSHYFTAYAETIKAVQNAFGDQAIVGIFEEIVEKPQSFLADIVSRTDADFLGESALPRENESPYAQLEWDATSASIVRSQGLKINHPLDISGDEAIRLLARQGTYTHFVPRDVCQDWFARLFQDDCKRCEDLLGKDLSGLWTQDDLYSPLIKKVVQRG